MTPDIWDVILLGKGSAARYYLTTVDRSLFPNILVIGSDDPWAGERGYDASNPKNPVNYINQTNDMIESFDNPNVPFSKDLVDRLTFAKRTRQIIDSYATKVVDDKAVDVKISEVEIVKLTPTIMLHDSVRKSGYLRVYTVKVGNGEKYSGKKVVVATGAGPHREPAEVEGLTQGFPNYVMDMNTFARNTGKFGNPETKTVFIHGPNAAIDTADTAKFQKFNVVWLVKKGATIGLLATGHQKYAKSAAENEVKEYPDRGRGNTSFKVTVTPGADKPVTVILENEVIKGDLYVYGMGQEPKEAMNNVIPPELRTGLVPIYDINQRYGEVHETVLGFKLENLDWHNGFEVIGSLCTQVERMEGRIKHTYLRDLAKTIEEVRHNVLQHVRLLAYHPRVILFAELDAIARMDSEVAKQQIKEARDLSIGAYPSWKSHIATVANLLINYVVAAKFFAGKEKNVVDADLDRVNSILTPSTVAHAQLGGIRATTAAMNGFVTDKPNFSQDDRTILRFTIAVKYPFVSEDDAQAIISDIITGRKNAKLGGYGYNQTQKAVFEFRLKEANLKGTMPVTRPKQTGTGKSLSHEWMKKHPGGWKMETEKRVFV